MSPAVETLRSTVFPCLLWHKISAAPSLLICVMHESEKKKIKEVLLQKVAREGRCRFNAPCSRSLFIIPVTFCLTPLPPPLESPANRNPANKITNYSKTAPDFFFFLNLKYHRSKAWHQSWSSKRDVCQTKHAESRGITTEENQNQFTAAEHMFSLMQTVL